MKKKPKVTEHENANTALMRLAVQGTAFLGGIGAVTGTHGNVWVTIVAFVVLVVASVRAAAAVIGLHLEERNRAVAAARKDTKAREGQVVGSI